MWEMVKRVTMCGVRGYAMLDINWSRLVGSRKLYRAVAMIYELLFTWTQIKMKRNNNSRPRGTFNVSARCYRSDKPPTEWKFILIGRPLHYARRKRNRVKYARQWLIHLENIFFLRLMISVLFIQLKIEFKSHRGDLMIFYHFGQ